MRIFNDRNIPKIDRNLTIIKYAYANQKQEYVTEWTNGFNDECFVLASYKPSFGHLDQSVYQYTVDCALFGYRHLRKRPSYLQDKRLFLKRIFLSVLRKINQKYKAKNFTDIPVNLTIVITNPNKIWVGSAGNNQIIMFQKGIRFGSLLTDKKVIKIPVVSTRFKFNFSLIIKSLSIHDMLLVITENCWNNLPHNKVLDYLSTTLKTNEKLDDMLNFILADFKKDGNQKHSGCLIQSSFTFSGLDSIYSIA